MPSVRNDFQNSMFKAQLAAVTDVFGYVSVVSNPQTLTCAVFELAMKTAQYHLRWYGGSENKRNSPQDQREDGTSRWRKRLQKPCRHLKRWEGQNDSSEHRLLASLLAYCKTCHIDNDHRFDLLRTWKSCLCPFRSMGEAKMEL